MKLTLENLHHYCTRKGACLIWKLGVNNHGYPIARIDGVVRLVRLYIYLLPTGMEKMPGGMIVRQKCDNPLCCERDHMQAATRSDLMKRVYSSGKRDKVREAEQKRALTMEPLTKDGKPRGDAFRAKLTPELANSMLAHPREPSNAVALRLKVCRSTVQKVRRGILWPAQTNT